MTTFTDREFRDALGLFATGVVVVTAEVDGVLLGSTVSSFNSVSLAPPLVLFSLARSARTLDLWLRAAHFGVTVLADDQVELSNRFARGGAGLRLSPFGNLATDAFCRQKPSDSLGHQPR